MRTSLGKWQDVRPHILQHCFLQPLDHETLGLYCSNIRSYSIIYSILSRFPQDSTSSTTCSFMQPSVKSTPGNSFLKKTDYACFIHYSGPYKALNNWEVLHKYLTECKKRDFPGEVNFFQLNVSAKKGKKVRHFWSHKLLPIRDSFSPHRLVPTPFPSLPFWDPHTSEQRLTWVTATRAERVLLVASKLSFFAVQRVSSPSQHQGPPRPPRPADPRLLAHV